eukprot:COSAG01_NODE_34957_length_539_cov_1.050000_2_plen_84_part_01
MVVGKWWSCRRCSPYAGVSGAFKGSVGEQESAACSRLVVRVQGVAPCILECHSLVCSGVCPETKKSKMPLQHIICMRVREICYV